MPLFFDDQKKMHQWVDWLVDNALTPGSRFHECLLEAKLMHPSKNCPRPVKRCYLHEASRRLPTHDSASTWWEWQRVTHARYQSAQSDTLR